MTELVEDIRSILIDRDDVRNLLTLLVKDRSGATHPARSLSDGTLRFIALAVLELDESAGRLFCLEEPENGIHPERIPAILKLLRDIAIDVSFKVDEDNPMRQVMINTHSPLVVGSLTEDELLFAETREHLIDGLRLKGVGFRCLPNAWWAGYEAFRHRTITRGEIINYLNPTSPVQQVHSVTKSELNTIRQLNLPF